MNQIFALPVGGRDASVELLSIVVPRKCVDSVSQILGPTIQEHSSSSHSRRISPNTVRALFAMAHDKATNAGPLAEEDLRKAA